jgi:deoxyadenosine/deoxycytidine kinase
VNKNPFIGIAGNIGVGKTTFTDIVAKRNGWHPFYESVMDNPYLSDFYGDMKRWSFNLQIYFLHHRFRNHVKMSNLSQGVIQDRTIYEDVEIFAKNLHTMGNMNDRDWENYRNLFKVMISFLRKPDLIIYLKASTDTLLTRIKNRNRSYETTIDPEYLHTLNVSYDKWIVGIKDIPVLTIDTNNFNIFKDQETVQSIIIDINNKL